MFQLVWYAPVRARASQPLIFEWLTWLLKTRQWESLGVDSWIIDVSNLLKSLVRLTPGMFPSAVWFRAVWSHESLKTIKIMWKKGIVSALQLERLHVRHVNFLQVASFFLGIHQNDQCIFKISSPATVQPLKISQDIVVGYSIRSIYIFIYLSWT